MENVVYSAAGRYADITKTMWLTFFYSPAIPAGILLSLISLILYYFIDKVIYTKYTMI